jgi:1-aminocyclopropane-1-carboxylate deaminase
MVAPPSLSLPSPVEPLVDDRLDGTGIQILLKRDDLIHPDFPGNKWRKLKYNLAAGPLLTFGGAYSNHLQATAAAGHYFGRETIGVVRGEEHRPLNPVLTKAAGFGMRLVYVDRADYRRTSDADFIDRLHDRFGDFHLIPEGGADPAALRGTAELVDEIDIPFDVLCCACGTGTTLAGAATALGPGRRAVGFPVLKGGDFLAADIRRLQRAYGVPTTNWTLCTGYHFGGFARRTPELDAFVADFHERHGIRLDPVYEAKMMFALLSSASSASSASSSGPPVEPGTTVLALLA